MPNGERADSIEEGTSGNEKHSARNPACDLCREKKVRCGREKPRCQNCVLWKAQCTYSERQKRDNEASRNAQRFEEVNARLDRIESTMTRLVSTLEDVQASRTPPPPPSPPPVVLPQVQRRPKPRTRSMDLPPAKQLVADKQGDVQYLGPSSLLSYTNEAETLLEERLKGNSGRPEQVRTIGALRKLSNIQLKVANFFPHCGHKELKNGMEAAGTRLPPREEANDLVNEYFTKIHHWFPIFDEQLFRKDMEDYYRQPEVMGKDGAWQACFNSVLLFGLYNKLANMTPEERARNDQQDPRVSTFFYNAWAAIDDLEVFLGPRLRNVQALMSAAVCAIEVSRPGLCWSLLSQAARTSQAIGLHRASLPSQHVTKRQLEERKYVFWNVYILDKCLSLSFGRSTCLPDYDCDVELPDPEDRHPYHKNFIALIQLAKIHSVIYVRLYSASAAKQSEDEREDAIKHLDVELREWWNKWSSIFTSQSPGDGAMESFERIELQFSYHSSMALVHRMARPDMASYAWSDNLCLENARASIRMINTVVAQNDEIATNGMLLWLFQYYPFTSFFVLFSAIIRNPKARASREVDYGLMKALVAYLGQMQSRNEGAAKLLSIASAFTQVSAQFLKNYPKEVSRPGKRRRGEDGEVDGTADEEERERIRSIREREMVHHAWGYAGPQFDVPPPSHTASSSTLTPTPEEQQPLSSEALQTASFLRWPDANGVPTPPAFSSLEVLGCAGGGVGGACGNGGSGASLGGAPGAFGEGLDVDIEALMAEPVGFQMQMEQAALRYFLQDDLL